MFLKKAMDPYLDKSFSKLGAQLYKVYNIYEGK